MSLPEWTKSKQMRRALARENAQFGETLQAVRLDPARVPPGVTIIPFALWRSRKFFVMGHHEQGGIVRLSIQRTSVGADARWQDGISWDDLQRIKSEAGYGERDAVEVFPADADTVNVANMRHLWVLPEPLPFAWRRQP